MMPLRLLALSGLSLALSAQEPETFSVHGQSTVVVQGHGAFDSPYAGPNSFQSRKESRTSFTGTLCLGWRAWSGGELYADAEAAGGQGDSHVLGLAGAPNGETYRVGDPELKVALARLYLRQTWDLGGTANPVEPDANQLGGTQSSRRLSFWAGRFAVLDLFDPNAYAHDPRTQFLNWALMGAAAYDYPADTRGYTWGLAGELVMDAWTFRAGSFLEPREANMLAFDHQVSRAHGELLELQHDHGSGKVHLLLFSNHARMGNYREALAQGAPPEVTTTRGPGRTKSGWVVDLEQGLTENLGAFLRTSRNDGRTETWAFTEADRSLSGGLQLAGASWGRKDDRVGLAFVENALSPDHADYLRAGGSGFLLGDGRLTEGPERILEAYYALAAGTHLTLSLDGQRIWNPGYNRDRGPVDLFAARLHLAF
ncbi:MAG TPA: carbohydrate porin [Holophagaceae bacterium]|nr:carbohydrate porin [Holophagaceae bacterium]